MSVDIQNKKAGFDVATSTQKFLVGFQNERNTSFANTLGELGLGNAKTSQTASNTIDQTIGAAQRNAVIDIYSSMGSSVLSNVGNSLKGGKTESVDELQARREQIENLTGAGASGKTYMQQLQSDIQGALGKDLIKSYNPLLGQNKNDESSQLAQFNKQAIVDAFKQSVSYKNIGDAKAQENAVKDLEKTVDEGNQKLIAATQEAATKAAAQIDQLIQVNIQRMDKLGGGAEKILSEKGPESGTAAREAISAYARVLQPGANVSEVERGRGAFKTVKAINEVSGGIPVFSSQNEIFKDVQSGLRAGLAETFNTTFSSLKDLGPGRAETTKNSMIDEVIKTTGANTGEDKNLSRDQQFQKALTYSAQVQAARATGLKDTDTEGGRKQFARQEQAAVEALSGGDNEKAKQLRDIYESANKAAVGNDPVERGIYVLTQTIQKELDTANSLLAQIVPKSSTQGAGLNTQESFVQPNVLGNQFLSNANNTLQQALYPAQEGAGPQASNLNSNISVNVNPANGAQVPEDFQKQFHADTVSFVQQYIQDNWQTKLDNLERVSKASQEKDSSLVQPPSSSSMPSAEQPKQDYSVGASLGSSFVI